MNQPFRPSKRVQLSVPLFRYQSDFTFSDARFPLFVGGFGSGKSQSLFVRMLNLKFRNPQGNVAIVEPTHSLVKSVAIPRCEDLLLKSGLAFRTNTSAGNARISIKNHGNIMFYSADSPERLVGWEVTDIGWDEVDTLAENKANDVWIKLLGRARAPKNRGEPNTISGATTPEGFKFAYKSWKKSPTNDHVIYQGKTADNTFLPPSFYKTLLEQYPENIARAYLEGEFVNLTQGSVYSYFDRKRHHTDSVIEKHEIIYVGQDFNVGGSCSACVVIRGGIPHCLFEIKSADTYEVVQNIKRAFPDNGIVIAPDATGDKHTTNASMSDINILENHFRVDAPDSNPFVRDRVATVQSLLYRDRFRINTKLCPNITEALETQAYNANGVPEKFTGGGTVDDWNDSLGYCLYRYFAINTFSSSIQSYIL